MVDELLFFFKISLPWNHFDTIVINFTLLKQPLFMEWDLKKQMLL